MDITTIVGIVFGVTSLLIGIAMNAEIKWYLDPASVFITFGGAICATIVQFPLRDIIKAPSILIKVFFFKVEDPVLLIRKLARYAEIARKDGILALEGVTEEIKEQFLVKGLQLAIDGTDPELISQMLNTEIDYIVDRHESGRKVFEALATYLPAFGMIGTLIGLIGMLKQLDEPSKIGPNMATALLTTFYGAVGAYLIGFPFMRKLELRSKEEILIKEMIARGVMSIQSGDNPRIVEQKLKIFLPPKARVKK